MLTDTSGPAAGSCGAWSGERRPSARPAVGHDPPPALRAAASASAARSAASCSSSSPGTPSPATRTAPNQQKMRDMGELRGPWRAAAERARPCRTPRGSSAPHAAGPTGTGGRAIEAALLVHLARHPPSRNGGRLAAKSRAPVRFGRAGWPFAPMGAPKTPLCEISRGGWGEAAVREAELHVDVRHLLLARGTAPPTARALPLHPLDLYLVGTVSAPATRWAKLPS